MNVRISHPTDRANFSEVTLDTLTIWFSYQTPIAFQYQRMNPVVRENEWGPTTGKHLNYIGENKSLRIPGAEFEAKLADVLA